MMKPLLMIVLLVSYAVAARAGDLTDVLDRYVAWRGGVAYERLQSIYQEGTLNASGLHGPQQVWTDAGARSRVAYDLGALKQTQVVTPEQTWETTPSGQVETMSQGDIQSLRRDQALQFVDALRGRGTAKAVLMPQEMRDGQLWAVVRVTFGDEDTYDAFIQPQTGALSGIRIVEDRQHRFEGFDDWRVVAGVRMPFLLTNKTEAPGDDSTFKVAAVELNQPIEASLLERPKAVEVGTFADHATSTGWIPFEFFAEQRIFFHAKINGHDTVVLLDSGATMSSFDQAFARSIGLESTGSLSAPGSGGVEAAGLISGVEVQIGNLTLRHINTLALDLAPVAARIGHPLPFVLGNELFNQLAVDIDFVGRRLAFHDPTKFTAPVDAKVVPLIRTRGNRSVPVSIEGTAPVQFDFDLGNGSPLLIFPAFYQAHHLLASRRTSQTFGGAVGGFHPEVVATLSRIEFAETSFTQVPTRFTPDTLSDVNSNLTQGNIGLPILARFRLIIDYSHDRLYAAPQPGAASTPFAKDRLGLAWIKRDAALTVEFVSPGSPAQAAGFKVGDRIALINEKPTPSWTESELAALRYGAAATSLVFTMQGGSVRMVKLGEFF